MATVMTKRGSQDNVVTYTHVCDTNADMAAINPQYINLGSTCLVIDGESGGLEVYIADSNKEWSMISVVAGGGGTGGLAIHICTTNEYDAVTKVPTVELPIENTIYLVPNGATTGDLFVEWIYVDDAWEKIGSIGDLSGLVQDVQVNGTSVVTNGVANVPVASTSRYGVVKPNNSYGTQLYGSGTTPLLGVYPASNSEAQLGQEAYHTLAPARQHVSTFYGLAKAAGADMKDIANATIGTYPDAQKAAIQHMLGTDAAIADYEADTTADQAYAIGELFMLNGKLHQATAAIAVGDTLTVGTNCSVVNAADVFPHDVKVNGTSVVQDGVANVPLGSSNTPGALMANGNGISITNGYIQISSAASSQVKIGTSEKGPITVAHQHESAFYGLAKAAGADMKNIVSTTVGIYPAAQKSAISTMLNAPETVTGTTPTITALPGVQYICGEVTTLDVTLPASGCVDIIFESGSSPTILTVTPPTGKTMQWPEWFDPTALDTNTTYELNIMNGSLGVVALWS